MRQTANGTKAFWCPARERESSLYIILSGYLSVCVLACMWCLECVRLCALVQYIQGASRIERVETVCGSCSCTYFRCVYFCAQYCPSQRDCGEGVLRPAVHVYHMRTVDRWIEN